MKRRTLKLVGWSLTTLLIPVVVFAYQGFIGDFKSQDAIEAEADALEFELTVRLAQVSGSFFPLLEPTKRGPRRFRPEITAEWLESVLVALRRAPIVDLPSPVKGRRIVAAPANVATKDMTLLGLLARGIYLQQQMLDFLVLRRLERVVLGRRAPADFCEQRERNRLNDAAARATSGARPQESEPPSLEKWRPKTRGTADIDTACRKAAKYSEAIELLVTPDRFTKVPTGATGEKKRAALLQQFENLFDHYLLRTVPHLGLPYIDIFAG